MTSHRVRVDSTMTPEETFDLLADMTNAPSWDPNVLSAKRLTQPPVGLGSRFDLAVSVGGRASHLVYEVEEYDRPRRVVVRATNAAVESRDTITVEAAEGGTAVTYDAELRARPAMFFLSPLLGRPFRRIVDEAGAGLAARLQR